MGAGKGEALGGAVVGRGKVSPSKITPEERLVATLKQILITMLFPGNPQKLNKGGAFKK